MNYRGANEVKVLVVYPDDAAKAIAERRVRLGLPPVEVSELTYGMDEVVGLVNLLSGKLLSGRRCNLLGLLEMLEEGWDIIWLITHGEVEGWYLNDGLVNVSEMTTMIRSSGVWLTVMNTCTSKPAAERAAAELGTAFICTITEVPDRQAFITGTIFAQKLAQGHDYVSAYEAAKPGQAHPYVLIEASDTMPIERPPNHPGRSFWDDRNPLDPDVMRRFIRSVEVLDSIIHGNRLLGVPSLKDTVDELRQDLIQIKAHLKKMEEQRTMRNILAWGGTIVILLLLATVGILVWRLGGIL